ncbi:hypothetical protein TRFO_21019 [Tritrichomonas foetus]|uniref:Borealin N-terminal domain-containing protein n=1 Tax=Tritrichomonas foetus TaxID=1144522 RepID=A0A1J4KKN8_9EUKA|nr:hypothetical protein TRFO_21019 [Tritrichomonas foetus]|eukprot:OHT09933.1 hypothetical protein TRFO_21019 [Tritrichomonas foetus]
MNSESVLADFDQEVKSRCELIRVNAENVSANLQSALDLTLLAIPELVRKMPVKELMEKFDGDIQKAATYYSSMKTPPSSPKKKTTSPTLNNAPSATGNKKIIRKEVTPTRQKSPGGSRTSTKSPKNPLTKSSTHLTTTHAAPSHVVHPPNSHNSPSRPSTPSRTARKRTPTKSPKMPKKP